ncbi:MAG: glycosyltransferase [Thermoanaerobaculales bacterium]|nr:glycosyltransferase [Thermoanaerobaculales bacterium]
MKASLVAVCHHSSAVLPRCVTSFRSGAAAAGLTAEVVLVEQSEDAGQAAAVSACNPDRLVVRPNRGYAAGLNAGAAAASGDLLLLANPDIELLEGSVAALAEATGGADVAGPQLLWDRAGEVLLPIPDDPGPLAELRRTLGRRWPSRRAAARRIEAAWRVWTADRPVATPSLRGPLLALRRDALARLGPLDEGYFLYYEETDWLLRARRRGARLVLAPRARVVHRWGHATARREDREAIEARSRARFFERNYPAPVRALLAGLAGPPARPGSTWIPIGGPGDLPAVEAEVWLLSIVPEMEPSVGCPNAAALPPAAHELTASGRWYAVAARRDRRRWRIVGRWTWERG